MPWLISILVFIIGFIAYLANADNKKTEEARLRFLQEIEDIIPHIQELLRQLDLLVNYKNGYFNNFKLVTWQQSAKPTQFKLAEIPYSKIKLEQSKIDLIDKFLLRSSKIEKARPRFNQMFIEHELEECSSFFNNIEGISLDTQQRRAIIIDEDNNIIVAGAGSGKTTTIAGKVSYLLHRFKVSPKEILLISFTRKACEEMRNRIKKKMQIDIDVMTFHKLGKEIIAESNQEQPSIFEAEKVSGLIITFLAELMQNPVYISKVTKFFSEHIKPYKEENEFKNHGEYIQFIKDNNIKCFKQVEKDINGRITLLREQCKSIDEVMIANFLFLNNIKYEYEKPYEHKTADREYAQYKPDFYLTDYGIYIEHFGIDRNGNVPKWFSSNGHLSATEKYQNDMDWKRSIHEEHDTTLIESYSYEKHEGVLLTNLESKLNEVGVKFSPKTSEEIWEILNQVAEDEVSNFTQLITTFLTLLKSNNYTISEIEKKNFELNKNQELKRNEIFLEIFSPVLDKYNSHLRSISSIDFSDMINHATDCVSGHPVNLNYKYIIVDEFQDISIGRYKLIKAVRNQNPGCKVFCVGDDWQSIYRFSGSDISLFVEFEKYFGVTEKSFIETTYRFNSRLIDISSNFILKNPKQIKKELKSFNNEDFVPYEIHYTDSLYNDDTTPVIAALNRIINEIWDEPVKHKILALGRYSHDIEFIKKDTTNFSVSWDRSSESYKIKFKTLPDLEIEFLTVHRAKGLEADFVLLLNCSSGKFGFPSEQADDPILNLLLTEADQFLNGEERRLFYVAMTRCKRKVHMISKSKYKSKFIVELEKDNSLITEKICPQCKTGILKESSGTSQKGKAWKKLSCSNWNWGCDYVEWLN